MLRFVAPFSDRSTFILQRVSFITENEDCACRVYEFTSVLYKGMLLNLNCIWVVLWDYGCSELRAGTFSHLSVLFVSFFIQYQTRMLTRNRNPRFLHFLGDMQANEESTTFHLILAIRPSCRKNSQLTNSKTV